MSAKVTLTVTQGQLQGQQYIFDSRTTCIIGRNSDCYLQLPSDKEHITISRYHCLLDINPPDIRVRDFGSMNGTYVNGKKIGQRQPGETPEEAAKLEFTEYDLQAGDEIKLGNTVLKINIEKDLEEINIPPNFLIPTIPVTSNKSETPNFLEIIKRFLKLADEGNSDLLGIRGYRVMKSLGKGGCGEVYLAQHQQSGKLVGLYFGWFILALILIKGISPIDIDLHPCLVRSQTRRASPVGRLPQGFHLAVYSFPEISNGYKVIIKINDPFRRSHLED